MIPPCVSFGNSVQQANMCFIHCKNFGSFSTCIWECHFFVVFVRQLCLVQVTFVEIWNILWGPALYMIKSFALIISWRTVWWFAKSWNCHLSKIANLNTCSMKNVFQSMQKQTATCSIVIFTGQVYKVPQKVAALLHFIFNLAQHSL